jgi:hypothetical protein
VRFLLHFRPLVTYSYHRFGRLRMGRMHV